LADGEAVGPNWLDVYVAEVWGSQSGGVGEIHQRFPGESSPIPTNQYLLSSESRMLLAIRAVTVLPPGRSSTRTRMPGFKDWGSRTPHPNGFTSTVWQRAEKEIAGSRLVKRNGICARTRVPCRRWIRSGIREKISFYL